MPRAIDFIGFCGYNILEMLKQGLIIVNAYLNNPSIENQVKRLTEEFARFDVFITVKTGAEFPLYIDNSRVTSEISGYDFCIFLDKDKYLSNMLEKTGLPLFNSAKAIETCDDKMLTYIALSGSGINLIKTLPGLLCYNRNSPISIKTIEKIENKLGYPVVVKESFGSLGKGVYKADNREELISLAEKVKPFPHIFEEFVSSSAGEDTRVIVVGGKVIAAMKRKSETDFRSNISLGGKGFKTEISSEMKAAAEKTATILKLDYCGIDFLKGFDGEPVVCEVNSNAFFKGVETITGINVAGAYAKHIYDKIYK